MTLRPLLLSACLALPACQAISVPSMPLPDFTLPNFGYGSETTSVIPVAVTYDFDASVTDARLDTQACGLPYTINAGAIITQAFLEEGHETFQSVSAGATGDDGDAARAAAATATGEADALTIRLGMIHHSVAVAERAEEEERYPLSLDMRLHAVFVDRDGTALAQTPLNFNDQVSIWAPASAGQSASCVAAGQYDGAVESAARDMANQLAGVIPKLLEDGPPPSTDVDARADGQADAPASSPAHISAGAQASVGTQVSETARVSTPAPVEPPSVVFRTRLKDANDNLILEGGETVVLEIEVTHTGGRPLESAQAALSGSDVIVAAFSDITALPVDLGAFQSGETKTTEIRGRMPLTMRESKGEIIVSLTTDEGGAIGSHRILVPLRNSAAAVAAMNVRTGQPAGGAQRPVGAQTPAVAQSPVGAQFPDTAQSPGAAQSPAVAQFPDTAVAQSPTVAQFPDTDTTTAAAVTPPPSRERTHPSEAYVAILIGMDEYRDNWPDAYRVRSGQVQAMGEALRKAGAFTEQNIRVLHGGHAAKSDIEEALFTWGRQRIGEQSVLVVYFAGQAVKNPSTGEVYLVPYEGAPDASASRLIALRKLQRALGMFGNRATLLLLDTPLVPLDNPAGNLDADTSRSVRWDAGLPERRDAPVIQIRSIPGDGEDIGEGVGEGTGDAVGEGAGEADGGGGVFAGLFGDVETERAATIGALLQLAGRDGEVSPMISVSSPVRDIPLILDADATVADAVAPVPVATPADAGATGDTNPFTNADADTTPTPTTIPMLPPISTATEGGPNAVARDPFDSPIGSTDPRRNSSGPTVSDPISLPGSTGPAPF